LALAYDEIVPFLYKWLIYDHVPCLLCCWNLWLNVFHVTNLWQNAICSVKPILEGSISLTNQHSR
jgi:hypothetical protein